MKILTICLAVALVLVCIHDYQTGRLLDKVATKYHVSNNSLKRITNLLVEEDF